MEEISEAAREILENAKAKIERDAKEMATKMADEVASESIREVEQNFKDVMALVFRKIEVEGNKEDEGGAMAALGAGSQAPDIIPAGGEGTEEDEENNERSRETGSRPKVPQPRDYVFPAQDIRYKKEKSESSVTEDWIKEIEEEEIRQMREDEEKRRAAWRRRIEGNREEEGQEDEDWKELAKKLTEKAKEDGVTQIRVMTIIAGLWSGAEGKRKIKEAAWTFTERKIKEKLGKMGLNEKKKLLECEERLKLTCLKVEQETFGILEIAEEHRATRLERMKLIILDHKGVKVTAETSLHLDWASLLCLIWPEEARSGAEENFGDKYSLR